MKRYINDIISLLHTNRHVVNHFIEQANKFFPIIKLSPEISDSEGTPLDTAIYKGERFNRESVLYVRTHFEPTETFRYKFSTTCHQLGAKEGFVKEKAL